MPILTTEEFRAWCQRLHIPLETQAIIARIRSSPPVRKVRGRADNVSGDYPSPKMGVSIQFESQHVELWGIYAMERDDDVLEYYDQPTRFPLHYHANSGRPTTQWHTPDFFVLRKTGAGFEEWKPAKALDKLAVSIRNRYQRDSTGIWRCPPGDAYANPLGLSYRLRSSAEYHPLYIQNLKFLQDFWAHHVPAEATLETLVLGPALRKELCNRKVDKYGPASSFGDAEELSYRHSWIIGRVFDRIQWSTPPIPSRQRGKTRPIIRIIGPVVYEKR